jgi:hypothetical protein
MALDLWKTGAKYRSHIIYAAGAGGFASSARCFIDRGLKIGEYPGSQPYGLAIVG